MKLRNATSKEIPYIMEIIENARLRLKAQGIDQWQKQYPDEETIENDIKNNESFVFVNDKDNQIYGTVAVSFRGEVTYEKIYEGEWISEYPYAVVHRIAVHNNYQRQGIATQVLTQIETMCKDLGVKSIRIDTHRDNLPMQKSLIGLSYTKCGFIYLKDGSERLAFEKIIKAND